MLSTSQFHSHTSIDPIDQHIPKASRGLHRSVVNNARRGVGAWGLSKRISTAFGLNLARNVDHLLSIWKLASRSAVKLAVGDEPRTGLKEK